MPTTILAQQHYNTFVQRMKDFPVTVDLLCRLTKAPDTKTLHELKRGMVDIIVGTHRVLSKDVEFKDLGLLIVDEEQRFGVTHKEKSKNEGKCGCADTDGNAYSPNFAYESCRDSRYERTGKNRRRTVCRFRPM